MNTIFKFALVAALIFTFFGNVRVGQSADYAVRPDDKLKVQIYQFPELSDTYTVNSNGVITIAPIGEVLVAGLSAQEISALISDRLTKAGFSDKPGTTVTVLESRPIYVMGDVQKPGEYSYRPGLTVLQAISLAGGYYRVTDPGLLRLERDAINISGELRNLTRRYYYLIARRARLTSELNLETELTVPAELTERILKDNALANLFDQERSILKVDVTALKSQLESLQKTRDLYEREVEAVSAQIRGSKLQSESVAKELNVVKALYARGLTTVMRQTDLERMQAQIMVTEQGFQTFMLRAQQNITQVDQKIFDLQSERRARLNAELQLTRLELEETFNKINTNRNLMMEARVQAPVLAAGSDENVDRRAFVIVRSEEGKKRIIDAGDHTELQPGDVLKVQRTYSGPSEMDAASFQVPG